LAVSSARLSSFSPQPVHGSSSHCIATATKGTYIAPKPLKTLSSVHQYQHLPATDPARYTPLRFLVLAAAVGLVFTTILGIVMAFRFSRNKIPVFAALATGVILPIALVLIYR